MLIRPECVNHYNPDGFVAGGTVNGIGLTINWQNGRLGPKRKEPNGASVESVIYAALQRLRSYQRHLAQFECREEEIAIVKLEEALFWLGNRTEISGENWGKK